MSTSPRSHNEEARTVITHITSIKHARRSLRWGAALAAALALGVGVGIAGAADQRLDEADAALQKAEALLEASQSGVADPRTQHRFERAVGRAVADVERARGRIVDAKDAAGGQTTGEVPEP
jgi:hypothetical protein